MSPPFVAAAFTPPSPHCIRDRPPACHQPSGSGGAFDRERDLTTAQDQRERGGREEELEAESEEGDIQGEGIQDPDVYNKGRDEEGVKVCGLRLDSGQWGVHSHKHVRVCVCVRVKKTSFSVLR